jgi:hypothetical protein
MPNHCDCAVAENLFKRNFFRGGRFSEVEKNVNTPISQRRGLFYSSQGGGGLIPLRKEKAKMKWPLEGFSFTLKKIPP